jgi:hypothetical protein
MLISALDRDLCLDSCSGSCCCSWSSCDFYACHRLCRAHLSGPHDCLEAAVSGWGSGSGQNMMGFCLLSSRAATDFCCSYVAGTSLEVVLRTDLCIPRLLHLVLAVLCHILVGFCLPYHHPLCHPSCLATVADHL